MNFGTILNSMTKHCVTLVMEGDEVTSKNIAGDLISYIQIKEVLQDQFKVYHNLNASYIRNNDDARLFVVETINSLSGYTFNDIKLYNALLETKFSPPKIKSTELNSHIGNLIKYATSKSSDAKGYVESLAFVTEHVATVREVVNTLDGIKENVSNGPLKFLEPKHVVKIAIKKFNEEFSSLNESEREVFNILRSRDEDQISTLFESQKVELDNLLDKLKVLDNSEDNLANKVEKSISVVTSECTQINILDSYELIGGLRDLCTKLESENE